jgi:hypothetical protein
MASEKYVMMLQEEEQQQPIDYRDVVRTYADPQQVQTFLGSFIQPLYEPSRIPGLFRLPFRCDH